MRVSPAVLAAALPLIGLPLLAACAAPETEQALDATSVTVFEGARLLVGDGSVIENATFVVDDDRLVAVGRSDDVEVPPGAERVDLTGRTVMPAIIDTHVHLRETRDELVEDLQRKAYYGVGVVLSLGRGSSDMAFQVRDEVIPNAARYRTVGRGITAPEPGRTEIPFWISTEAEARTAVQALAPRNVDMVKIWVDDRNGQFEKLTPELYGAVIDEAHQQGLRVTAHVYTLEDAKGLLRAGLDAFAHGIRDMDVDDEVVELFAERPNVVLVPNLPNPGVAADLSWLSGTIPPDELQQMQERSVDRPAAQEAFGIQARNLARLSAEGVTIAFGTDGGAGWSPHAEMEDMVRTGMTPADVIVSATRNSANLLALDDVGTLEAGKSADFIVLEANPLDDITNTRRIVDVYLRGTAVDRAALSAGWVGSPTP
ncbi:MAG: amidohydrolase family protein [Acidobacteria bacterium]|nr:amidohydrolase family protein [Acidobacteriota bacterium]